MDNVGFRSGSVRVDLGLYVVQFFFMLESLRVQGFYPRIFMFVLFSDDRKDEEGGERVKPLEDQVWELQQGSDWHARGGPSEFNLLYDVQLKWIK